jgi:hypothetical protein
MRMTKDSLLPELDEAIVFQSRWSDIMSVSHTSMSALIVTASGAATVVAALGYATEAAILAAVSTISFGLEKALMLREKWAHHLATAAQLRSLRLALVYGGLDTNTAAQNMGRILQGYAIGLPIASRTEAAEVPRRSSAAEG